MDANAERREGDDTGGEENDQGAIECEMEISPNRTKQWLPTANPEETPYVGQQFKTAEEAILFYQEYARAVGFDVRHSTMRKTREGKVAVKYMVCSREGFKPVNKPKNNAKGVCTEQKKRRRVSKRVGCKARIVITRCPQGGYKLHGVELRHTHCLCSDIGRPFLKVNRKLDSVHKTFLANCAKANIGPFKGFRLYKEMVGSFSAIGATCIDFRNFRRDMLAYISGADAQMLVEDMFKKKEISPDFYFDFDLDDSGQLCRLFWADGVSRKNFACFGDVMSFDATYRTNRYNIVFVPFTGVDNHKRCITFGAGLLGKENSDSYEWLLKSFKTAMGATPRCAITDQDPALKVAVPKIMPTTRHRFCMWHIMTKVRNKVEKELAKNKEFRKVLNNIVWDETLSIEEFERKWQMVMEEYNLVEDSGFAQLYEERASWIPAYFHDIFMGGLLKTTSRSESENCYYGNFTNHHCTLVEFYMQFNSAIEEQRYKQSKLNAECEGSFPEIKTPLGIERQAAASYTTTMFYEFQKEVWESSFTCHITGKCIADDECTYRVKENGGGEFEVTTQANVEQARCTCKKFNRMGILCRHVLSVLRNEGVDEIPGEYIVTRWTRNACTRPMHDIWWATTANSQAQNEARSVANQLWNEFYNCMGLVNGWHEKMEEMLTTLQQLKKEFSKAKQPPNQPNIPDNTIESILASKPTGDIQIKPPRVAKNKGSGKRLKSTKENVIEKIKKKPRLCATCRGPGHDSRNCEENKTDEED